MKRVKNPPLLLVLLLSLWATVHGQSPHDDCANAIQVPLGAEPVLSSTAGASTNVSEPVPACWLTAPSGTVWFQFTTTTAGLYTITTDNGTGIYETDTQLELYSGTCGSLMSLGCNEDGGSTSNALAGQVTANLAAATTYYVMVDVYGAAEGEFAINVSPNIPPVNDCIFNAIDLTAAANGLGMDGSACASYYFNPPGNGFADGPTEDHLAGDLNQCNGLDVLFNPIQDHRDIWFYVDIGPGTPSFWVSAFQDAGGGPHYCLALYQGNPTGSCGGAGMINGLTYMDCSNGDVAYVPPGNEHGGTRDKGLCTTPLHPRLDLSLLPTGRYYLRLWEALGGDPSEGIVRLCLESTTRSIGVFDLCPNLTYTPCVQPNQDYTFDLPGIANVAVGGNSCNTAPNEPQLAAGVPSDFDEGCTGSWLTGVGYVNNVMNNSLIIPFIMDAIGPCDARVELEFSNMSTEGSRGKVAQVQVMNTPCDGGSTAVMNVSTAASCLRLRPSGNGTLPAGIYYLVMDGQDGNLIRFDLRIAVTYSGLDCSASTCGPLDARHIDAQAVLLDDAVKVDWKVSGMATVTKMELQRSQEGNVAFSTVYTHDHTAPFTPAPAYEWVDAHPLEGSNVYRVVAHDLHGQTLISPAVEVHHDGKGSSVGQLHPNPTTSGMAQATLDLRTPETLLVTIHDLQGRLLSQYSHAAPAGRSTFHMSVKDLARGLVMVTLTTPTVKKEQLLIIE